MHLMLYLLSNRKIIVYGLMFEVFKLKQKITAFGTETNKLRRNR